MLNSSFSQQVNSSGKTKGASQQDDEHRDERLGYGHFPAEGLGQEHLEEEERLDDLRLGDEQRLDDLGPEEQ